MASNVVTKRVPSDRSLQTYACALCLAAAMVGASTARAQAWNVDAGVRVTANWLDYRSRTSSAGAAAAGGGTSSSPAPSTVGGGEAFVAYAPSDAVRLEVSYERLASHDVDWTTEYGLLPDLTSSFSSRSRIDVWMVSAYVFPLQLGRLRGMEKADVEPFIGIGVGKSRSRLNDIQESYFTSGADAVLSSGRKTDTAYRISVGVAKQLTHSLRADIAFRYAEFGETTTGSSRSGVGINADQLIEPYQFKIRSSTVSVGIAYRF